MKLKITKWIMSGSLVLFLVLISAGSLLAPDRAFSGNENRYLAKMPELSLDSILNGDFQNGLEAYLNDQILGRDQWITIKTAIQKAVGDTDIGGAYVGKDGYDFEKITQDDVNQKLVERNIAQVQKFFESCNGMIEPSRMSFLLVPTSGLILEDKLPANAPLFDQTAVINQVKQGMDGYQFIDVRDVLTAHKEEGVYYRTDHHWTSKGAFVCYEAWCQAMGMDFVKEDYVVTTVTEEFRGSLYSKILDYDSAYDSIQMYEKKDASKFSVMINGEVSNSFYHYDQLEEKDKYLFFFGGNYNEVVITNESLDTGRKLLLVKDSFANAFAPMVAENYDQIYMVDLRYFRGDMRAYMEEHGITDVLVLYNVSNFISDKNIHKLN